MSEKTTGRKYDHLRICLDGDAEFGNPGFDDVRLVHNAIPEIDFDEITVETEFLNRTVGSPLVISAMTGGHSATHDVNKTLAAAAEKYNLVMGVGSQRAALEDKSLEKSFSVVRDTAPNAFLAANIGAVQLAEHGMDWAQRAVEMIDANALCVHLNFLQEAIQPEGECRAKGVLDALREVCKESKVPVIVKETGSGLSGPVAAALFDCGAAAVDVGGFGGTSWAKIEGLRCAGDKALRSKGEVFLEWGIPTAVSVFEVSKIKKGAVISTGGLKTGLDIAKSAALGADMGGMALALLAPAHAGETQLFDKIDAIIEELKTAMFLTGSKTPKELANAKYYLTGVVREMTANKGEI